MQWGNGTEGEKSGEREKEKILSAPWGTIFVFSNIIISVNLALLPYSNNALVCRHVSI